MTAQGVTFPSLHFTWSIQQFINVAVFPGEQPLKYAGRIGCVGASARDAQIKSELAAKGPDQKLAKAALARLSTFNRTR
jgi:hypothetical protein